MGAAMVASVERQLTVAGLKSFSLLDAGRSPKILRWFGKAPSSACLFSGRSATTLASVAPYLVEFGKDRELLRQVLREGWGESWGSHVLSDGSLTDLRRHFRKYLMAEGPDAGLFYFRFYDPRVLRVFLPACNSEEARAFFGPVRAFVMEHGDPHKLLKFTLDGNGLVQETVAV